MRTLQTLFAGLVALALILGGLAVAAVVALAAVAIMAANRLLGRRTSLRSPRPGAPNVRRARAAEAIDIEVAEVTAEPPQIGREPR